MTDSTSRYAKSLMNTFGVPQKVFVGGEGAWLIDEEGKRYLDYLSGIAVTGLGQCHPDVVRAITEQSRELGHISNFFASKPQIELAERLTSLVTVNSPELEAKVFFTNSGAEANEAALKITRLTGKTKIISMDGSFHGRTMGSLAITSNENYRKPFEPLPGEVVFVPFGDLAALEAVLDETVAAVVVEPIQGENGVVPAPQGFLEKVRKLTETVGALLWVDEIQTGMGRCGNWFAFEPTGITPDIVTLAKGLGNGFPMGACLAVGEAANLFTPGSHGTTYGGNPVACAAGLAVMNVIERDNLLSASVMQGTYLHDQIMSLNSPLISEVRGRGLLRGVVFKQEIAAEVNQALLADGFVTNAPRPTVLRLAPPLIITTEQIDLFVTALGGVLGRFEG